MTAKEKEDLWNTLEDLADEEFKLFKWFLKEAETSFAAISASRLEKADRQDTVDLMVHTYGGIADALQRSTRILEKISRNDLVQRLSGRADMKKLELRSSSERGNQKANRRERAAEVRRMIKKRSTKIEEIQRLVQLSGKSADKQIADSFNTFNVLIESLQRSLDHLVEEIEKQQKETQRHAEGIIQELKQEISELTKTEAELEKHLTEKHDFLQGFLDKAKSWTEVTVPPPSYEESVENAVKELKGRVNKEMERFLSKAQLTQIQQFAVDVTLDPNTAHPSLVLSEDRKQVHCGDGNQNLPDDPERFNTAANVLGKQSFSSGRFYFQVQVSGKTSWDVGVVQGSITRKGSISSNPEGGYWTVGLRGDQYKASRAYFSVKTPVNKVGVFVDHQQGFVYFYDVDSAEIIYSFSGCSFNEKLLPFFSPGLYCGGLNSNPLVISPVSYTH